MGERNPGQGEELLDPYVAHRDLLFTVAYQMLGSVVDAEDVVQETWLRWREVDQTSVGSPRAYLVRITTRLALNMLRTQGRRRETYVGPWLPEPLLTTRDVADDVELADSVSLAMLVVLDSLPPAERAVFVLREVFGFGHEEIAEAIGRSPGAIRQLAHRARLHVRERREMGGVADSPEQQRAAIDGFLAAVKGGDLQALLDLLAPDVVLLTDGGGQRRAALRPVRGADKVARFLVATAAEEEVEFDLIEGFNAGTGVLVRVAGELDTAGSMVVSGGRITTILVVRNPDKLGQLTGRGHLRLMR